ncbi:MAG: biopolymer transporter ExbD [Gammaproteobacteria bacterium]|nr:biopolymer transporter ExbD [Gammaproteobacteria bacterium]
MKMSRRARRMERHHKRKYQGKINLVSLMDIFTILVFFLLVNSSNVAVLPSTKDMKLPKASVEQLPKETLVIVVNNRDILIHGKKVASIRDVMNSSEPMIKPLQDELNYNAARSIKNLPDDQPFKGEITIMGDKQIPYSLLKKIMATCSRSGYSNISLAVAKKMIKKQD